MERFALVGGTSLALRFGHRKSIDLDFFTTESFDLASTLESLRDDFEINGSELNQGGMNLFIEKVKVDMVTYKYELLEPLETIQEVRMFSLRDTVAMKLSAVANRGAKKDFFDVLELMNHMSIDEMLDCYRHKFPDQEKIVILTSLSYFDDADLDPDPESLNGTTWDTVKNKIAEAVGRTI